MVSQPNMHRMLCTAASSEHWIRKRLCTPALIDHPPHTVHADTFRHQDPENALHANTFRTASKGESEHFLTSPSSYPPSPKVSAGAWRTFYLSRGRPRPRPAAHSQLPPGGRTERKGDTSSSPKSRKMSINFDGRQIAPESPLDSPGDPWVAPTDH